MTGTAPTRSLDARCSHRRPVEGSLTRRFGANLEGQTEQPRRREPSRKVRTPKGKVVDNVDPGKPAGKCHRKDTAYVRGRTCVPGR